MLAKPAVSQPGSQCANGVERRREETRRDETRRDEASQGVHTSMGRIISAGRRKINKRNITSAAGSTELGSGHGIGWGKRDGNGSRKRC